MSMGSRAQVFHGNADKTTGGLKKGDLKQNENGKIVSKKASAAAKKTKNLGNFQASGKGFELAPKKGTKAHKELKSKKSRKSAKKSRKSAKKSRKSAKKSRKSAKKSRKSRKSRKSKK